MVVKKGVYGLVILVIVLVTSIAVQGINQKVIIDVPGSFIMNGKNISVLGSSADSISVDVDGIVENIKQDKITNLSKFVNGVYIQIIALSKSPTRAILNVTVNVNCGNNVCEIGEDFTICCADCGCSTASLVCSSNRCVENITKVGSKNQCYVDADCDDKNTCTTERCDATEYPNKCVRTDVTVCVAGDKCCPKSCETDKDADCVNIDKCDTDADCLDNEACTQETCTGAPKRCQYTAQEGCTYSSVCIVKGTVKEGKYCEGASHEWLLQKVDEQNCTEDFECISGICGSGTCGKTESKTIVYTFYIIALVALIMVIWYVSLTRKARPQPPSLGQP